MKLIVGLKLKPTPEFPRSPERGSIEAAWLQKVEAQMDNQLWVVIIHLRQIRSS